MLAHCINITLLGCCRLTLWMLLLQEIDEFERGLSGVDHNIRHHSYSSSIVKRQEFDDQRGLFYKRSLHFGIKNLKQYLRMNTDSMQKGSVDLKAIAWLRNSIVLIVLGPYHGSIDLQLTLCATMQSPRRLHIASTAFSCCRYRSLFAGTFSIIYKYRSRPVNKQFTVPFSLHRTF